MQFPMMVRFLSLMILMGMGSGGLKAETPTLAPIDVRPSIDGFEFYDTETFERFVPRGFNYFIVENYTPGLFKYPEVDWELRFGPHAQVTFHPDFYDASVHAAELDRMKAEKVTTVRIYFEGDAHRDESTSPGERLNQPYMDNFAEFIDAARDRGIYTVVALGWLAPSYYGIVEDYCERGEAGYEYRTTLIGDTPCTVCTQVDIGGFNTMLMHAGIADATGQYIVDILDGLEMRDPTLLSALMGVEVANEPFFDGTDMPFSLDAGTVQVVLDTADTYDMDKSNGGADRQRLADEATQWWVERIVQQVRADHPETMLTLSVFSPYVTSKTGYLGVDADLNILDTRQPPRLAALQMTSIDYLDMHIYPSPVGRPTYDPMVDFDSAELDMLALDRPILMSEFGWQKLYYPDFEASRPILENFLQVSCDYGFSGWVYFAWGPQSPDLWTPQDEGGEILQVVSPVERGICATFSFAADGLRYE